MHKLTVVKCINLLSTGRFNLIVLWRKFSISIRSMIIVLLFPLMSHSKPPGERRIPVNFKECGGMYRFVYSNAWQIRIYNTCNTSTYDGLNGMYEIHIVQFLALSLPFFFAHEAKHKRKRYTSILTILCYFLPLSLPYFSFTSFFFRTIVTKWKWIKYKSRVQMYLCLIYHAWRIAFRCGILPFTISVYTIDLKNQSINLRQWKVTIILPVSLFL